MLNFVSVSVLSVAKQDASCIYEEQGCIIQRSYQTNDRGRTLAELEELTRCTCKINANFVIYGRYISNGYTMDCPHVRGDNPRALASGLSYVQADKHGITIL